jgi:predicted small lipoprotein YifL
MPFRTLVIAALAIAALAGCGRRGALEPPGEPQTTVVPSADVVLSSSASPGTLEPPRAKPIAAPDRPFILDPLI